MSTEGTEKQSLLRTLGATEPEQSASIGTLLAVWFTFSLLVFAIYWPALEGPFISDDILYVATHPWVNQTSLESVLGILNPFSDSRFQVANYAPVHILLTMLERNVFWDDPFGYHVVNLFIHALNATLLFALFLSTGLSRTAGLLGALVFLVHPANVEAVAWISQLKTLSAMAFSLGALILFRRHPAWATGLFVMGLLSKASAAFALPVAGAMLWVWAGSVQNSRRAWLWLGAWVGLFALYSVPQYTAMTSRGLSTTTVFDSLWIHLLSIASVGTHYILMASTSLGIAHAQEFDPVASFFNPWVLSAVVLVVFFIWRIVTSLRQGSYEAAYWLGAAASFVPVSQWFPFDHPIADRYLYFLLPGLIGGVLFLLRGVESSLRSSFGERAESWLPKLARVVSFAALALVLLYTVRTAGHSRLWTDQLLLSLNSAKNFPSGRVALRLNAAEATQRGELEEAYEYLKAAGERGGGHPGGLILDESLAPLYGLPEFQRLVNKAIFDYINLMVSRERPTQSEWLSVSNLYLDLGDFDQALLTLERARDTEGMLDEEIAMRLKELRTIQYEAVPEFQIPGLPMPMQ